MKPAVKKTKYFWGARRDAWVLYGIWWRQRSFIGVSFVDQSEEWKDEAKCPECRKAYDVGGAR